MLDSILFTARLHYTLAVDVHEAELRGFCVRKLTRSPCMEPTTATDVPDTI